MFRSNPAYDKLVKRYDDGQYVFTYRFISDNYVTYFRATYTTGLGWYYRDCGEVPKDYITFSELVDAYRSSNYLAYGGSKDTRAVDYISEFKHSKAKWSKIDI